MLNGISFNQIRENLSGDTGLNFGANGEISSGYSVEEINKFIEHLSVDADTEKKDEFLSGPELEKYLSKNGITYDAEKNRFIQDPSRVNDQRLEMIQDGIAANKEWAVLNAREIEQENLAESLMDNARNFTVSIDNKNGNRDESGSGFIIKRDGNSYIVATNKHVTNGAKTVDISHPEILDSKKLTGEVIAESDTKDIAFIKVDIPSESVNDFSVAKLGEFNPNIDVSTYGYPAASSSSPPPGRYNDFENPGASISHSGTYDSSYLNARFDPATNTINLASGEKIDLARSDKDDSKLKNIVSEGYEIMTNDNTIGGQSGGPTISKNENGDIIVVGMHGWSEYNDPASRSELRERLKENNSHDERFINGYSMSIPIEHVINELNKLTDYKIELN